MLTMKEKALVGIIVIFIAVVAASVFRPVKSFEVELVTNPAGNAIHAPADDPFNITCQGLGGDDSKFSSLRWMNKEGNIIPEGIPGTQRDGKNSVKLVFISPKIGRSGVYKCAAVYDKKHVLEKIINLIFYGQKPTFESYYANVTAEEGSKLEVNCSAIGDWPIAYEWYQYEDKVSENNSFSIYVRKSESQATLVIHEVAKNHEGMYTCMAKNEHGLTTKVYQVVVRSSTDDKTDDGAPSILKVEVKNITSNSVKFLIYVSGSTKSIEAKYRESRENTEYRMQWDYDYNTCDFNYWQVDWQTAVKTCESENKKLLCYNSKKEIDDITEAFRLSAISSAKLSIWLSNKNCSGDEELQECLSLHIEKKSDDTVWHYFQESCDDTHPFVCCVNSTGDNYEVKGLYPGGKYSFRFRLLPSQNDTTWSESYSVTLLPVKPELILQKVAEGIVKLSWFVKANDIMRGTIDGYELKYFKVMNKESGWSPSACITTIQLPSCTGASYTLAGLSSNVYYELQLRSHTAAGYGEPYRQKIHLI